MSMDYEDMRDMQRREEQGDSYIPPTRAVTGVDWAEMVHDAGGDEDAAQEIMLEVMSRDMARYESQVIDRLRRENEHLRQLLEDNGIETE